MKSARQSPMQVEPQTYLGVTAPVGVVNGESVPGETDATLMYLLIVVIVIAA